LLILKEKSEAKHLADNYSSADFHIHFLATELRCLGRRKEGFFMAKRIKLTPIQKTECHWMINKTCLDTLPEYQEGSDVLLFRNNFIDAADDFKKQQKENRYDIKLYEFQIEWIKTGYKLSNFDKNSLESDTYDSKHFLHPTPF
jgi:hypothetical protein